MNSRLIAGVDGGATSTTVEIARLHSGDRLEPVASGRSGPSNPQVVGFETAAENIRRAFDNALGRNDKISVACLAIAGAGRDEDQQRLLVQLNEARVEKLICVHDALAPLAAISKELAGITLISGTGSFAFGQDAAGANARCGGWGHFLGDEGSGFRIGMLALEAVCRTADGRGAVTSLTNGVLQTLELDRPQQLIAALRTPAGGIDVAQVAGLSRLVFAAAKDGDSIAHEIIAASARSLAEMVKGVGQSLSLPAPWSLAMAGGVFASQPSFRELVCSMLTEQGIAVQAEMVAQPALGALRLAAQA